MSSSSAPLSDTPLLWADKRFHTWNYEMREQFGGKVFKVMLDAGFTCPNRDGTIATGGCTFCSARGSGDFAGKRRDDLEAQFATIRDRQHQKWPDARYIGYFQAYTNTYAPVEELREYYETILAQPGVVGLSIATRPDCLPDDVVDYLAELNERTYLWVEMGRRPSMSPHPISSTARMTRPAIWMPSPACGRAASGYAPILSTASAGNA